MIWMPLALAVPVALIYPAVIFSLAALLLVAPTTLIVAAAKTAKELILALKLTSFAALTYSAFFALGLAAPAL
jgi:1,4-dihydroxy-2-naphthoate octaprenyltransferase